MTYLIQLITAFTGSLGFGIVFKIPRERLLPAALGGLLAWGVYLALGPVMPQDVPRFFVASVVLTIYSEILARVLKCPTTVFLVIASIPLIPGGSLYRTMNYFMKGDFAACSVQGLSTLLLAVAIAVGMLFPMAVFQLVQRLRTLRATSA